MTTSSKQPDDWALLLSVIDGPLPEIAKRFSQFLAPRIAHDALVIFTRECTGRPRKVAGRTDIVERVTVDELEVVKNAVDVGGPITMTARVAGEQRRLRVVRDATDTLLVLIPRQETARLPDLIDSWFALVAMSIRHRVAQASPDYLAESRAASSERARTITQLTEMHESTLTSILGTLRSPDLDDRTARVIASGSASDALIALRSVGDADRELSEESLDATIDRIQTELMPLVRHAGVDVEHARPPAAGQSLPGETAHAVRAIVRAVTAAFLAQPTPSRMRIGWSADGESLLVEIRDHGSGKVDGDALRRQLGGRLQALDGHLDVEVIDDWGSRVTVRLPLDSPTRSPDEPLVSTLNPRELEVLGHLGMGKRNKAIAAELGVSESTIKFHVTGVLQKLQVSSRSEAGLIAVRAGIAPPPAR
ncbi:response regulator transcription factor family protein [Gordonia sp. ABSL49_1]|uniref:helix-turn-helix transcriptional regulator n=1 Tax=Gordonia sp. ABSL49_1 TaxID=2920941 RepID=UPI001F0FCE99|nr:LuxR C-terminal-related transcriptional regulator [Gordonia sp. ABSL49_1]MCH5642956.1 LuxR C-terminal-related transcriptional regulator [Gordonia sp. ABSL49_1]